MVPVLSEQSEVIKRNPDIHNLAKRRRRIEAECARLESGYTFTGIVSSNLTASALLEYKNNVGRKRAYRKASMAAGDFFLDIPRSKNRIENDYIFGEHF